MKHPDYPKYFALLILSALLWGGVVILVVLIISALIMAITMENDPSGGFMFAAFSVALVVYGILAVVLGALAHVTTKACKKLDKEIAAYQQVATQEPPSSAPDQDTTQ